MAGLFLSTQFGACASWRSCALAALLLTAAAPGCGDDDDDAKPTTPAAGTSGGTAAASGTGGGMSYDAPQPVECGATTCTPAMSPLTGFLGLLGDAAGQLPVPAACCLPDDSCGVTSTTTPSLCEPPATEDKRCPAIDTSGGGAAAGGGLGGLGAGLQLSMVGCCIENKCGQDGALLGRGCVENSEASSMLSAIPLIGMFARVPTAQACDAPPVTGDDAGVVDSDAGL